MLKMIKARIVKSEVDWAKGRPGIDWSALLDGQARHFEGIDNVRAFQSTVHAAARRHEMKARTTVADGGVYVQFYEEE